LSKILDPIRRPGGKLDGRLAGPHAIDETPLELALAAQEDRGGTHRVGGVRSQRPTECRQAKATSVVLGEDARSDNSPQDPIESTLMTSGDLSQFIAALWSVGEQIRDPQYGNHVKRLRN